MSLFPQHPMKTAKTASCILELMVSAFFVLSGCQSTTSSSAVSNDPIFAPVPERQPVFTGEYVLLKDADTLPKPVSQAWPVYPSALKNAKVTGRAMIAFIVTVDGRTDQVQIEQATHRGIGDAAAEAIRKWRFTPAMRDGKPVNCMAKQLLVLDIVDEYR